MEPQISVVIIALNEENYLPHLLEDLSQQTKKPFEVIVVDGGSTDKTKEKALEYKNKLNLHVIVSPKAHMSFQRNYGAKHAKGAYLFFLDADSRVEKNILKKLMRHISQEGKKLYLPMVTPSIDSLLYWMVFKISTSMVMFLQKLGKPLSFGPFIVIERNVFQAIGGFDENAKIAEDHNIVIKAYKKSIKATFLKDVVVSYSVRRFEKKGKWKTIFLYISSVFITLNKGAVFGENVKYKMGGQEYK